MPITIFQFMAKNPPSILIAGGILYGLMNNPVGAAALILLGVFLQICYLNSR